MRVMSHRRVRRRGAALVEAAIILPVFTLLVFGLIEASRLAMVSTILTEAAREGCRLAVIDGYTNSDVTTRVNQVLTQAGISTSNVTQTQTPTDCTSVQSGDNPNTVTLSLSVPYSKVSWLGTPYLFKTANVTASATMSSERP